MVSIVVKNRTHEFDLEFSGKFNIIVGDSGDHKTHFVTLCNKWLLGIRHITGDFKIDNKPLTRENVVVYSNGTAREEDFYRSVLASRHNSLFIIDEFCTIFKIHDIASLFLQSDNYFILLDRGIANQLPKDLIAIYLGNCETNDKMRWIEHETGYITKIYSFIQLFQI